MIAHAREVYHDYELVGGLRRLYKLIMSGDCREVSVEGPAGTGKSFAICLILTYLCEQYPDIRVLFGRKTLRSMRDTILVTLEHFGLPPNHPAKGSGKRHHQSPRYVFDNGSEIVCHGFDDAQKIKSSEYDIVYVNECTELSIDDWEIAMSRLRHGKLPLGQFGIADCNPGAPQHWLNKRPQAGRMVRIKTRHEDNPALFDPRTKEMTEFGRDYIGGVLDSLTGVRYLRLRKGEWVAAEGAIWENFNPEIHTINDAPKDDSGDSVIVWHFASIDWGFRNPGALLVWGVDKYDTMYLVHEVYRSGETPKWWAEKAARLKRLYGIELFVCDPSDPGSIDMFNRRMRDREGEDPIAYPANNAFEAGVACVRERFEVDTLGRSGIYILRDSLDAIDSTLSLNKQPTCLADEIPSYCYREIKDGQEVREVAAPDSIDHACDAMRYGAMWLDKNKRPIERRAKSYPPWSYGDVLNHDKVPIS